MTRLLAALLVLLPSLAFAQAGGPFVRPDCTALTGPTANRTVCFDTTTGTWKVYTGSSSGYLTMPLAQAGAINVKDVGATGNGTTDDTEAIQKAIVLSTHAAGTVYFPCGDYNATSTLRVPAAVRLKGCGHPGSQKNPTVTTLRHNFDGTFIHFVGDPSSSAIATGGGLEDLLLLQGAGNGSGAKGTAVLIHVTSSVQSPNRIRLNNLQIEEDNGKDAWTYAVDLNGLAETTNGVHDIWVMNSRLVGSANSTAAIRMQNARNIHLVDLQLTGTKAAVQVTGQSSSTRSSAIYLNSVSGLTLDLDWAANVVVSGGAFTGITTTSNTLPTGNIMRLAGGVTVTGVAFADLPSSDNGTFLYCSDCTANSNPCSSGGTGAFAKRLAGAWTCD